MLLHARPASANIIVDIPTPGRENEEKSARRNPYLSFQVLPPDGRDHLDLDAGEVFQHYNYVRISNKHEKIDRRTNDGPSSIAGLRLQTERDAVHGRGTRRVRVLPGNDFFTVYVAPPTFRELADNVKIGLLPETVTIEFEDVPFFAVAGSLQQKPALEYGWEPDGSGMVWHNTEREDRSIPIENIKLDYAVLKPRYDQSTHQLLPMIPEPAPAREQIAAIQSMLVEMSKHLRWAAIGIMILAIIVTLWMIRHG